MLRPAGTLRSTGVAVCLCGVAIVMSGCGGVFGCGICISFEGNPVYKGVETHVINIKDTEKGEIVSAVELTKGAPPWQIVKDECSGNKEPCKVEVRLTEYKPVQHGTLLARVANGGTNELALESK